MRIVIRISERIGSISFRNGYSNFVLEHNGAGAAEELAWFRQIHAGFPHTSAFSQVGMPIVRTKIARAAQLPEQSSLQAC